MNHFRVVPSPRVIEGNSYVVAQGRHRDIRYKIANVRGTSLAVYIGLPSEHSLFGANLGMLKEVLPQVEWSYASPDLLYANRVEEPIWWIGWIYTEAQPTVEEINSTAKTIIKELAKGVLRGEISPNH